jgi:hypothetical protein
MEIPGVKKIFLLILLIAFLIGSVAWLASRWDDNERRGQSGEISLATSLEAAQSAVQDQLKKEAAAARQNPGRDERLR